MANDVQAAHGGHPEMDYPEHERTYDLFIRLSKWGLGIVIVILAFMAYFLV